MVIVLILNYFDTDQVIGQNGPITLRKAVVV
jgi:hypothetical protein